MQSAAATVDDYLNELPEERRQVVAKIHQTITEALPDGFDVQMAYGMIGYVVPHALYPSGYHCAPKQPLPFMSLANQKRHIGLYHMGLYEGGKLHDWFVAEYPKQCRTKLDMGKCCVRLKKVDDIPYELISDLAGKITAQEWISIYESSLKQPRTR
ncbi:DUF1801 domain-containing protein [Rubinisphaera margarita]|uniref:DUF1801 domain-containing protein n=1 Tax=Rubinisphaera margarita TaxID=2909586 RepID=UPI001EE94D0C|nr:DUF1801 domain-containing protein [Rubinisphaera margarita]MCG6155256.1 DUF1801 domain-containing protein [Rubinisphaera margarita]